MAGWANTGGGYHSHYGGGTAPGGFGFNASSGGFPGYAQTGNLSGNLGPGGYPSNPFPGGYPSNLAPGGSLDSTNPGGFRGPGPSGAAGNFNNLTQQIINVMPPSEETTEQEERIRDVFLEVAGEDQEVDWAELQRVLNDALERDFAFDGFSKENCRSMISMMDVDRSGKLGLREFIYLYREIRHWKNCFKQYDTDGSGKLTESELRSALSSAGYHLNNRIGQALMLRYGDKEGNVSFGDFIMCSVKLRTMMRAFEKRCLPGESKASFPLGEFIEKTMYF